MPSLPQATIRRVSLLSLIIVAALSSQAQEHATPGKAHDASYYAFRNAATDPPKNPTTPVFKLSRDYPHSIPDECKDCGWLDVKVNFAPSFTNPKSPTWHGQHWDEYIQAILDYVKQGQDPNLANEAGWNVKVDGKTRWFNVPWMAYDPTAGREYVHGTTNERTASLTDLVNHNPHALTKFAGETEACIKDHPWGLESWSVGYYNEYGGYALGRAIPATGVPQMGEYMGSPIPAGLPFPTGTVVVKILTSTVPPDCVPFLKGSPAWQIDRHKLTADKGYQCEREVQISHVVQVDVAVVDPRSPIRWVYGTFAYDSEKEGSNFWEHLVPVGLQWGADPWTFPAVPKSSSLPIQQSAINTDINTFQHLGCEGRLAGPVDNPVSSCTSCHAGGYIAPHNALDVMGTNVPPIFGFDGMCQVYSLDNTAYFQNPNAPQPFPGSRFPDAFTMDTSLQLAVAFTEYATFFNKHQPNACTDPNQFRPVKSTKSHALLVHKEEKEGK
jgi:hypothetical protein